MISRRDFLQASVAASAIVGASGVGNWAKLAAQQTLRKTNCLILIRSVMLQSSTLRTFTHSLNRSISANLKSTSALAPLMDCPRM